MAIYLNLNVTLLTVFIPFFRKSKDDSHLGPIRGRTGTRRGRAPPREKKEAKTAEDLDKELDAFMGDDAAKDLFSGTGASNGDVEMTT